VGGVADFETTGTVGFGACNDSATNRTVSYVIDKRWLADQWVPSGNYPLGAGGHYAWYYSWAGYKGNVLRGASYRVKASAGSGAYHPVTGVWWSGL
jgi:hypothetical protein